MEQIGQDTERQEKDRALERVQKAAQEVFEKTLPDGRTVGIEESFVRHSAGIGNKLVRRAVARGVDSEGRIFLLGQPTDNFSERMDEGPNFSLKVSDREGNHQYTIETSESTIRVNGVDILDSDSLEAMSMRRDGAVNDVLELLREIGSDESDIAWASPGSRYRPLAMEPFGQTSAGARGMYYKYPALDSTQDYPVAETISQEEFVERNGADFQGAFTPELID